MKIDVKQIFFDYILTIRGEKWTRLSIFDALLIFGIPVLASGATYFLKNDLGENLFLSLFTLFGVFIAVFISIQGVLIDLFRSQRAQSDDKTVDKRLADEEKIKKILIREMSFSLSYLKLFSLISMGFLIFPIAIKSDLFIFQWISIGLAVHLIINLLVVLKRLHALLSHEFEL